MNSSSMLSSAYTTPCAEDISLFQNEGRDEELYNIFEQLHGMNPNDAILLDEYKRRVARGVLTMFELGRFEGQNKSDFVEGLMQTANICCQEWVNTKTRCTQTILTVCIGETD